jgi:hypothetical protein
MSGGSAMSFLAIGKEGESPSKLARYILIMNVVIE